jgi:DnaJ-domain-containing protein 1
MFESGDPKANSRRTAVILTLTDGTIVNAALRLPLSNRLNDALNNTDQFLDLLDSEGRQLFFSKRAVRKVEPFDVPKATLNMSRNGADEAAFDPYQVLRVAKDADAAKIRQAYLDLARKYHPDRFAAHDLPKEMLDYAAAMLVRINLAYEQIGA